MWKLPYCRLENHSCRKTLCPLKKKHYRYILRKHYRKVMPNCTSNSAESWTIKWGDFIGANVWSNWSNRISTMPSNCNLTKPLNYRVAGDKDEYFAVTQFAPTDCRRCFPCWDEPAVKARFDVTLVAHFNKVVLSNMVPHDRYKIPGLIDPNCTYSAHFCQ